MIKSVNINTSLFTSKKRKKIASDMAMNLLKVMQSSHFKYEVCNMDRNYWLSGETKGSLFLKLTNNQIYKTLMEGKEEWNNEVDHEIDLIVGGFARKFWSKAVAYMNPGKPTIFFSYKYLDNGSDNLKTQTMGHEWSHTMGARHSGPMFRQSFAYFMNHAINICFNKVIHGSKPSAPVKKETYCVRSWRTLWFKRCYTRIVR